MRAPSSFHSTDAGPVALSASATVAAVAASIGCTGCSGVRPMASSPASPSVSATVAAFPRSPENIAARRTASIGTPAAFATASVITPSSAPWRNSPTSSR